MDKKKRFPFLASTLLLIVLFSFGEIIDWVEYTSVEGNYKILMPAQPQEQSRKIPSALGELTMYIAMFESEETDDNLLYMSAFSEYPNEKINSEMGKEGLDRFFKGTADGSAKSMNGKVKTITESKYKDYPTRQVVCDVHLGGENFIALQKMILIKNKFYMLQTFTKSDKADNANAKKFFGSFDLNK